MSSQLCLEQESKTPKAEERAAFDLPKSIVVEDVWLEVEIGGGWRAAFRLVPYAGQPVIGELRVFPADRYPGRRVGEWRAAVLGVGAAKGVHKRLPRRVEPDVDCPPVKYGVTARMLRRVPLGAHLRDAKESLATLEKTHPKSLRPALVEWGLPVRAERKPTARRAGGRTDLFYSQLAAAYVARLAAGSRRPIKDIARQRSKADSVIRDAVHEARERGLLTAGGRPGVPGGTLTPLAETILRAGKTPRRK
jgi:hypothetical protein